MPLQQPVPADMNRGVSILGRLVLAVVIPLVSCARAENGEALSHAALFSTARSERYEVRMQSSGTVGGSVESAAFAFELTGELEVTPLELGRSRSRLLLAFVRAALSGSDDAEVKQRLGRVAQQLERPSVIGYANGAMSEAELGKNLEALTVGILRNLGAALQLPNASGETEVSVTEYDATGRYSAQYEHGAGAGTYAKRKLAYDSLILDAALQAPVFGRKVPPPKIVKSRGELQLRGGRLVKLDTRERLEIPLLAGSTLGSETTISLVAGAQRRASAPDRAALAQLDRLPAAEPYRTATARFDFNAIKIGGRGFDELLSMLEALATRRERLQARDGEEVQPARKEELTRWTGEQNRTLTAMATLLRSEPELTGRALAAVRVKSPAHHVLISALGAAGVESSQRALLELMKDDTLSDEDRNAAGLALIRTKTPAAASVRALEALLDDESWHQYAILGLGTYCRLFRDSGRTDEHVRLGELLLARLHASAGSGRRADVFSALSNSGYAGMLDAITIYLDDPDSHTREQAMRALRLVHHPELERLAVAKLRDPAPGVRLAALEAAEHLGASAASAGAVQIGALHDDNANVRLRALRLLIAWKDRAPEVLATIKQVAAADPSQPIRQVAARAFASQG